ncbi:RDD family protein [Streptomyces sp. NPDC058953]|uniref:RDD family protein n=1 Tax=unclassified Streptomyces TaxID=2593676 RepID=UPI0036CD9FB7
MSALVTGDAVVLGLQPAKLPSRALAMTIDLVLVWGLFLLVSFVLTLTTASLDPAAGAALAVASFLLVAVGMPISVETLSKGRSPGKLACGLRVVRDDGGPIRFRHALVRGAMGVVEITGSLGVIACIASLVSARGRRIGDVFAGTLVVRERVPTGRDGRVPPPPPWLAGRFAALDLSAVPDDLWLAIRQYLTRSGQLDPAVGWSMGVRLADEIVRRTGARAPEGVHPGAFLAAVVHERQTRDARRAFGTEAVIGGAAGVFGGDPSGGGGVDAVASRGWAAVEPLPGAVAEPGSGRVPGPRDVGSGSGRIDAAGDGGGTGASGAATGFVPPG